MCICELCITKEKKSTEMLPQQPKFMHVQYRELKMSKKGQLRKKTRVLCWSYKFIQDM